MIDLLIGFGLTFLLLRAAERLPQRWAIPASIRIERKRSTS